MLRPLVDSQASAPQLCERYVDRLWAGEDLQAERDSHRAPVRFALSHQHGAHVHGEQTQAGSQRGHLRRGGSHGKTSLWCQGQRHNLSAPGGRPTAEAPTAPGSHRSRRSSATDRSATQRRLPGGPQDQQDRQDNRPGDQDPHPSSKGATTGAGPTDPPGHCHNVNVNCLLQQLQHA